MSLAWRGAVVGVVALLMLILSITVSLPQPVRRPGVDAEEAGSAHLTDRLARRAAPAVTSRP